MINSRQALVDNNHRKWNSIDYAYKQVLANSLIGRCSAANWRLNPWHTFVITNIVFVYPLTDTYISKAFVCFPWRRLRGFYSDNLIYEVVALSTIISILQWWTLKNGGAAGPVDPLRKLAAGSTGSGDLINKS